MNSFSLENMIENFVTYQPYIYKCCLWIFLLTYLLTL